MEYVKKHFEGKYIDYEQGEVNREYEPTQIKREYVPNTRKTNRIYEGVVAERNLGYCSE